MDFIRWKDPETIVVFNPPRRRVTLISDRAWPGMWRARPPGGVPTHIGASEASLDTEIPVHQLAWLRTNAGCWLAIIKIEFRSANRINRLDATMVVHADAIKPLRR